MRALKQNEFESVCGGDDTGNARACDAVAGAGAGLVGAVGGPIAGSVAATLMSPASGICQVATTAAGQAIASGIAGAGEAVGGFQDDLANALGALQMTMNRGLVNWFSIDGT